MNGLPDFIIIGAMKCATSTLHDQLAAQPGVFMTEPKEPCFFSDDRQWRRGMAWYRSLFAGAPADCICGESSTHYTKLPTYPQTVSRMRDSLGDDVRLIYMMRHPIDRLVSQYIHEWSQGAIGRAESIDDAVEAHREYVQYSRYAYQLAPYREAFGEKRILPVFFERFVAHPQEELSRVWRFLELAGGPQWRDDLSRRNQSSERLRRNVLRDSILGLPGARRLIRAIVPQQRRHEIARRWSMQQRPELSPATIARLQVTFDDDLAILGQWLGIQLTCESFRETAAACEATWNQQPAEAVS